MRHNSVPILPIWNLIEIPDPARISPDFSKNPESGFFESCWALYEPSICTLDAKLSIACKILSQYLPEENQQLEFQMYKPYS